MHRYQHILAAIDFSHANNAVIERARELAEHYDARLTLLHVVEDVPLGAEPFGEPSSLIPERRTTSATTQSCQSQMQALAQQFNLPLTCGTGYRRRLYYQHHPGVCSAQAS